MTPDSQHLSPLDRDYCWQAIIDCFPHPVWIKDTQSLFLAVNKRFRDFFGKSNEEIVGKSDFEVFSSSELAVRSREEDYQVMTTKEPFVGRSMLTHPGGDDTWTEVMKSAIHDADGTLIGTIGVLQNITSHVNAENFLRQSAEHLEELVRERTIELVDVNASLQAEITTRKETEAHLREAILRAEQSEKLKDIFIANISHEIRTPLNSILGFADLVELELAEFADTEQRSYFRHIKEGSARLMRTVEQILNLSSLQAGTLRFQPVDYHLQVHLSQQIRSFKPVADEKGIELRLTVECEDPVIPADGFMMDYCLNNLLDNAVKFTSAGYVEIRVYRQPDALCIDIHDTGIGIAEEYLPRLFSTFSQEKEGYTRPFDGLGLGLALSRQYVEMNRGEIRVDSVQGVGTTFSLRFSTEKQSTELSSTANEAKLPGNQESEETPSVTSTGKPVILVVEDDEQTQKYMGLLLRKRFEVFQADSGDTAWEIIQNQPLNLVLMDISLRGNENGLQLTQRIRSASKQPQVPVIALTAFAFADDRTRCLEAGCNDFLSKPFDRASFEEILTKYHLNPD